MYLGVFDNFSMSLYTDLGMCVKQLYCRVVIKCTPWPFVANEAGLHR